MFSCICYCQLFQPPCFLVFVIADEFSVVPTSMFSCICYCRWILSCSNLHVFLYLLLQMNSQLFQPPCFLVFVIADEFSVVPTSMFSCICYCRWILSCSNLHVIADEFSVFVIADEFSVVPTSMFSCICYCRWILSCSNLHVFLYLLLQMNSQLFQPPCFLYLLLQMNSQLFQPPCILVFVIADEFSVVPTSMFSCICYCRWILSCSNLHVFLYLLLQMNSQLFQPSMFSCICYCRWILSCSNLHVFQYLLLQMNS